MIEVEGCEGYFDGNTIFNWWKRSAIKNKVEYIKNEVVSGFATRDMIELVVRIRMLQVSRLEDPCIPFSEAF